MIRFISHRAAQLLTGCLCCCLLVAGSGVRLLAQGSGSLTVNLGMLDGVPLTHDNACSFIIQSGLGSSTEAEVKGSIRYRQSGLWASYTGRVRLSPGMNRVDKESIRPQWSFSGAGLQELFMEYHTLPEGTYEYCVSITPLGSNGEVVAGGEGQECIYGRQEDLFLINLVSPENNAKLYEHYPVFSWIVNYPFASQLTYKIRVAEIREGQNAANAVVRNNSVYTESNLPQTTTTYPVYGTPLKVGQPYGWTIDAYYKGVLLGGAEAWKFTIIEDSEMVEVPKDQSYYEFTEHHGETIIIGVGSVKLKYVSIANADTLKMIIKNKSDESINLTVNNQIVHYADNLFEIDCRNKLQHKGKYFLYISNKKAAYTIPFVYYNPLFVK